MVYYMVLAIDLYIPGRRLYLKRTTLKRDVNLPVNFTQMLTNKFWEKGITLYIGAAGFQHKSHQETCSIRTMA